MKTGIIIYSQTGVTLAAAEKLKEKLAAAEKAAEVVRLQPTQADPKNALSWRYDATPDLSAFDTLVFAAPVQAFQLCGAMKAYLPKLPDLSGKKVALFVTKGWASAWTGATKALAEMENAVNAHGGTVCCTGFAGGMKPEKRAPAVDALVEKLAEALG